MPIVFLLKYYQLIRLVRECRRGVTKGCFAQVVMSTAQCFTNFIVTVADTCDRFSSYTGNGINKSATFSASHLYQLSNPTPIVVET